MVVGKSGRAPAAVARASQASPGECLVSAETDVKAAAGFVCAGLRSNKPPVVKAISAPSVNQALKTLALAHDYLADESSDLYVQVDFPEYATAPNTGNVALHVFKKARRTNLAKVNAQSFVSSTSEAPKVRGSPARLDVAAHTRPHSRGHRHHAGCRLHLSDDAGSLARAHLHHRRRAAGRAQGA